MSLTDKMAVQDVNFLQEPDISSDIDNMAPGAFNEQIDGIDPEISIGASESRSLPEKNTMLKYCVVASFILHVIFLVYLTQIAQLTPTKASLAAGPNIQSVRLVELPPQRQAPEPPPEQAPAVSDRDHTAEKQRLPKMVPGPKPPLPKIEPLDKRLASRIPPMAPEDFVKPREKKKEETSKNIMEERSKPKPRPEAPSAKDKAKNPPDLRATRQEIARALSSPEAGSDYFPEGDVDEAVVDINTREEKFFSYLLHLKRKIQGVWVYPQSAARQGVGGVLSVEFSIARSGELLYVNLLDSSGNNILDDAAMKAVKTAAPYYPFPERMRAKRLRIRANFIYVTGGFFRSVM